MANKQNPLKKSENPKTKLDDPLDTSPKGAHWLHVASCGLALYNLAYIQHWIDWPNPLTLFGGAVSLAPSGASAILNLVVGAVLTAAGVFAVKHFVDEDTVGGTHETQAMWLAGIAGASATAWLVGAEGNPSRPMSAVLLVLWATVFGVLYVILRSKEPERMRDQRAEAEKKKREIEEYKLSRKEAVQLGSYRQMWEPWLIECGIPGRITSVKTSDAGYTLTIGPYTNDDGKRIYPSYTKINAALPDLASRASEYYEQHEDNKLPADAFRLEATDTAHKVLLHVTTTDFLKENHEHPGVEPPRSITAPIVTGVYEDGTPLEFEAVGQNGIMVGATESGKSTYTHNYIAAWLASYDGELWVAGMRKLMPLVGPWLDPWLHGYAPRPCLQRIAGEDPDEVLKLLADFYEVANEYNKTLLDDKRDITPDEPAMGLIIDESSTIAHYTEKKVKTYDNRWWTAEALFNEICQVCRSAGLNVFFLTQFGLVDALGEKYGTKTLRNVNVRIVGRTNSPSDGRSILNASQNVDTTTLRHNTLRAQTSKDQPRVLRAKARNLRTREQIRDLAIAYAERRHHPPAWIVQRLGESYTGRWNPERQPDLVARCKQLGVPYPELTPEITGEYLLGVDTSHQIERATPEIGQDPDAPALPASGKNPELESAMQRLAEQREIIRIRGEVINALRAEDAPDWVPAAKLAVVAHLVGRDAPEAEQVDAEQRLIDLFTRDPYNADVELQDEVQGWPRDLLLTSIRRVLDAERARAVPAPEQDEPTESDEARKVFEALAEISDEWVRVGELGRMVGAVASDDPKQARIESAAFGKLLREEFGVSKDAFKAGGSGTLVNVDQLRAALSRERGDV